MAENFEEVANSISFAAGQDFDMDPQDRQIAASFILFKNFKCLISQLNEDDPTKVKVSYYGNIYFDELMQRLSQLDHAVAGIYLTVETSTKLTQFLYYKDSIKQDLKEQYESILDGEP